jgi:hypothetical protein
LISRGGQLCKIQIKANAGQTGTFYEQVSDSEILHADPNRIEQSNVIVSSAARRCSYDDITQFLTDVLPRDRTVGQSQ